MIRRCLIALAAPLVVAASGNLNGNPLDERNEIVSYADLDLSDPADAARLERRVRAAAKRVCEEGPNVSLRARASRRACERGATEQGLANATAAGNDRRGTAVVQQGLGRTR